MKYKVFLSPTKNLNNLPFRDKIASIPHFLKEANYLVQRLKHKKPNDLIKLMSVSDEIANTTYDRFQTWDTDFSENSFYAIKMYAGEAFKAFDFETLNKIYHRKLQDSLFILSGLYGVLKPFDLVHPYRLEIGLPFSPSAQHKNLYSFWESKILNFLKVNLKKDDIIVNLASKEYYKVLNINKLPFHVVTPQFKEYNNGSHKMVMMYAKNARGKMARYIIENEIKIEDDLKKYNLDGYHFDEKLSTSTDWLFVR